MGWESEWCFLVVEKESVIRGVEGEGGEGDEIGERLDVVVYVVRELGCRGD